MKKNISLFSNESGATAIEYGLILALIALALTVSLGSVGTTLESTFQFIGTKVTIS